MYAMIVAVVLGQIQEPQEIELGTWLYKDKHQYIQIEMKEFGRFSGLKTVSLLRTEAGRDLTGKPYLRMNRLTGFYSVEKQENETLIYCRFQRWTHQTEKDVKAPEPRKVDYSIVLHAKPAKAGGFEIHFTSDDVINLVGWPKEKRFKFQSVKQKTIVK